MANTASSGRDQRGINFKNRAGNGRAADAGVRALLNERRYINNEKLLTTIARFGDGIRKS